MAQLRTSPQTLGIDFGVSALKLLQLGSGSPPTLIGAAALEVPESLRDRPMERFAFQAQGLGKLLKESGIKAKRAACSVSAATTLVHIMRVSADDGASIRDQISRQLSERLGCNPAKFIIRHVKVGEVHWRGQKLTEVLCTVMPRETVLQHMEALSSCKLEVTGVHCEQLAIGSIVETITSARSGGTSSDDLIIDIGYGFSKMLILRAGEPVYAKTIDLGGRHLDMKIAEIASCSLSDAAGRRSLTGIPTLNAGATLGGDAALEEAPAGGSAPEGDSGARVLRPVDDLIHEITLGLRHHMGTHPGHPVHRLVLCGGESRNTELCRYIGSGVGLHTQAFDPFSLLERDRKARCCGVETDRPQPGWTVAMGLCMAPTAA